jgi:cytochrome P450
MEHRDGRRRSREEIDVAQADDPRAMTAALREQPVVTVTDDMVLLTRRADIDAALRCPSVFSSGCEAVKLGNVRPLIPLQIDPPKHVKYRRILDPLFAPRRMAALEGEIASLVDQLVDGFAASGRCDFHEQFAVPLPCTVFLDLFGLPMEDLDRLLAMKEGIIRPPGATLEEQWPVRERTAAEIYAYFEAAIAEHRRRPRQDLLSQIMTAEVDGLRLSDEELLDVCFLFIIAGLDTVTDSLDCIFAHLAQHPDHRQALVADEDLVPSAVEELLRWESPVPAVARVVTEDTEVGGCPIRAGQQVMLLLASANTDTERHPGVDTVDLARNPNPHLAFGGGVHRCLGSHLARVELRTAVRRFHRRIPEYHLAPGTKLEYTVGLRSLHHLPLEFDPAGSATAVGAGVR